MDLVDKKGLDRTKPRLYRNMAAWVMPWVRPLREARALLLRALEEIEKWRPLPYYVMWVYTSLLTHSLACGDPLPEAHREAEEGRRRLARARVGVPLDLMTGQLGLIRTLRGLTPVFGSFGDEELVEHQLEQHLRDDPWLAHAACWYWIRKLQAHVYAAEHERAAAMAEKARRFLWTASADFLEAEYHFHAALARAAAAGPAVQDERRDLLAEVAAHHQRLLEWAANCSENFEARAALVGAEIARLEGRELDAERLYEQAIRSARVNGFLCIEALANETAGRFYAARGFDTSARAHLREARQCYLGWGAEGKVRQLDERYPHLGQEDRLSDAGRPISEHLAHLELATVLKALRAVSGEIVLERLVDTLMRMAIEHAGADRGVLLLTGGGGLLKQAEATISGGAIVVRVSETPVSADDVADTVVRYVARTQDSVILNDTSASHPFSRDASIHGTRAHSMLCLPLVKQGRLIGLLYLENRLAPGVFTPARIAVLQVLASQAAMSLENSRLYRELERREAEIHRLVDTNIVGVAMTRADGAVIHANAAALEIVGRTREDVRSGRVRWRELTPPEWLQASERAEAQLRETGSFDLFEKELLRKDGTRVPVLLAGAALDDARQERVVFVIDLTERKRAEAELRRARAALARHQRASMLGEMAAAIAHEIRQPIAAAMIDATACLRALADDRVDLPRAREAAARMVKEATWADQIIDRTTALYRRETTRRETVDVNAVVREMSVLLQQEAGAHSISVRTVLAEGIPEVRADRVQLQQVLMNLMLNAIAAMNEKGGELTIRSQVDQEGGLLISVSDTGVGLPTSNPDEIFDAFATTKPQGTGIGLAITRSIVESHGGRLWATANAGPGATFAFTLPRDMEGERAR
jgi:PAS domain S-box-containing protein